MESIGIKDGCNPLCRACSHRGWSMEKSLNQKQDFVTKTLTSWSDVIHPIKSVDETKRWHYRISVTLAAEWNGSVWNFGTRSRDELIPIHRCPIHHSRVNQVVEILSIKLPPTSIFPLAFLVFTKAQCVLVVKQKPAANTEWLTNDLAEKLKSSGVEGFWIHHNPSAGRRLFEKGGWLHLFGSERSVDSMGLAYGPTSFQQQIEELYHSSLNLADEFLMPNNLTAVVDLYCGTGTSLRRWRAKNAQCVGVETSAEALDCATENAPGSYLLRGACRLRIPQLSQWVIQQLFLSKQILIYANPPRTGMEPEVLDWIVRVAKPRRMAYLSCSPGTLSKNLHFLTQNHYKVLGLYPFDFFPQTHHVECLAILQKEQ